VRSPLDAKALRDGRARIVGSEEKSVTATSVESESSKTESTGIAWEYASDE